MCPNSILNNSGNSSKLEDLKKLPNLEILSDSVFEISLCIVLNLYMVKKEILK